MMPDFEEPVVPDPSDEVTARPDEYASTSPNISEAGGIAWCNLFTPNGLKINITERRATGVEALNALIYSISYGESRYGLKSEAPVTSSAPVQQPQVSQPPAAPQPGTPMIVKVTSVKHIKKKGPDGKHLVIIGSNEYPDGLMAFDRQMPKDLNWMDWELFKEYTPPTSMAYAVIDPVKKWVTEFRITP